MLRNLVQLVKWRVEDRVREELECAIDRLEWLRTPEEAIRVARSSRSVRQQMHISELEMALEKQGMYLTPPWWECGNREDRRDSSAGQRISRRMLDHQKR
jgi:hypothetical protein